MTSLTQTALLIIPKSQSSTFFKWKKLLFVRKYWFISVVSNSLLYGHFFLVQWGGGRFQMTIEPDFCKTIFHLVWHLLTAGNGHFARDVIYSSESNYLYDTSTSWGLVWSTMKEFRWQANHFAQPIHYDCLQFCTRRTGCLRKIGSLKKNFFIFRD
jgi:hypothetical protein